MYELRRRQYQHRPGKGLLVAEWLLSFVVAAGLTFGGWFVYAEVVQGWRMRAVQQSTVKAESVETCIATGNAANGSQSEVCPD